MNKFLFTETFFPSFNKKESNSLLHCVFYSVFALKSRSIKTQRSVAKVLITLLIKQFYQAHWLVINICLKSVVGRKDFETNIHQHKYSSNKTCAVIFILIFSFHRVILIFVLLITCLGGRFEINCPKTFLKILKLPQ